MSGRDEPLKDPLYVAAIEQCMRTGKAVVANRGPDGESVVTLDYPEEKPRDHENPRRLAVSWFLVVAALLLGIAVLLAAIAALFDGKWWVRP